MAPAFILAALLGQVLPSAVSQARAKKPVPSAKPPAATQSAPPPLCSGDYADVLPAEKASAILESAKGEPFVFAIRNTATYEHVYFGRDGKLRRAYHHSIVHGTGFAYRGALGETLLATNDHVANQPEVTDDDHPVEGVPTGSKKVREQLKIVRDEQDDYQPGHVALTRVFSDPAADIAVLKSKKVLPIMPYRIGRSSALRPGNMVAVRGFPLGAFAALNTGKVLNPYTEDTQGSWNHADFVIDALLAAGNSGSPVFAVSCRTGELELVGVFHAGYTEATALNVVVAIDQLREELESLKVPKRDGLLHAEITAQDRDKLVQQLFAEQGHSITFPFGGRAVLVELTDPTTLRFGVLDDDFPLVTRDTMALIDHATNGFGTLDVISVMVDEQLTEAPVTALEGEVREHFERLYDSMWRQLLGVVDYRSRIAHGHLSADTFADAQAARSRIRKRAPEQKELLGICTFESDRANFGAAKAAPAPAVLAPPAPGPAAPAPSVIDPPRVSGAAVVGSQMP